MAGEPTPPRERPWLMRTYSGHSSARASNELYRKNLAKGQTGLSVAFDLPTQTGYDSDHSLAKGEVGKVGVPICHVEDMEALLDDIPLEKMNTSMTINATAAWLLALYVAVAKRRGVDPARLEGTTQNDIIKEYLSRGTHISTGAVVATDQRHGELHRRAHPEWNPINVCSYHLQEAGATRTGAGVLPRHAICVLDTVRCRRGCDQDFPQVVGRINFFVNAGVRFVEEMCKLRAFTDLGRDLPRPLRRDGREASPLPLRRPSQLARSDRGSPGTTYGGSSSRCSRWCCRSGRAPAPCNFRVERGARAAAALGPAVVAAHPTGDRLRERHPRVRGSVRRIAGD
jgi:(2R)-ethylmalonyl-CoA mutase